MKRIVIALAFLFPGLAAWAAPFCEFDYTVLDNRAIRIDKCTQRSAEIVEIPATIDVDGVALPVESFGRCAFMDCFVTTLTLPDTVKDIGSYAFAECSALTNVSFAGESSLTNIGTFAFYRCSRLPNITIPASVVAVGDSTFFGCPKLTEILFEGPPPRATPPHLFDYPPIATAYYRQKNAVEWEAALESDGTWDGFPVSEKSSTSPLTDFEFAVGSTGGATIRRYIGSDEAVIIPEAFGDYPVVEIWTGAFAACKTVKSVEIPESVKTIGARAFQDCGNLSRVTIPSTVATIDRFAFENCAQLKVVRFARDSRIRIFEDGLFRGCSSLAEITIPAYVAAVRKEAFAGCSQLENVYFEGRPLVVEESAFSGVPTNCRGYYLSEYAFAWTTGLESDKPWYGPPMALSNEPSPATDFECTKSETGVCIDEYVGAGGEVVIPAAIDGLPVVAIGESAFSRGVGLIEPLTAVSIPASVERIGTYSFHRCDQLERVVFLGDSRLKAIGLGAFDSCTSLPAITMPDALETIGYKSFADCVALTSLVVSASVTNIEAGAFTRCPNLVSVVFGEGTRPATICYRAFEGCISLSYLRLPASVGEIQFHAFNDCANLRTVVFEGAPPTLGTDVFGGVSDLCTGHYSSDYADAWEAGGVIVDGKWHGIFMQPGWVAIPMTGAETAQDAVDRATSATGIPVTNDVKITEANLDVFLDVTDEGTLIRLPEGETVTLPPYYTVGVPAAEGAGGFSLALNERATPVLGVSTNTGTVGTSPFVVNADGGVELYLSETIADPRLAYSFKGSASLNNAQWETIEQRLNVSGEGVRFTYAPTEANPSRYRFFKVVVSDAP